METKEMVYTLEEKQIIGDRIGSFFQMHKTRDGRGRYVTDWGDKTAIGLFETILVLAEKIKRGEF